MFDVIAAGVIFLTLFVVVGFYFKTNTNINDKHDLQLKRLGEEAVKLVEIRNSDRKDHFQAMGKQMDRIEAAASKLKSIHSEGADVVNLELFRKKRKAAGE